MGPLSYRSQDAFDRSVTFTKVGGKYSFGVGRESMNKVFVDEILEVGRKNQATPSPGNYEPPQTFGKVGIKHSMSGNLHRSGLKVDNMHNYYLDRQSRLPGPGSYSQLDTVGNGQVSSILVNSRQSTIPKAEDRFLTLNPRKLSPPPTKYSPRQTLGQEVTSTLIRGPRARIGNNKTNILVLEYGTKKAKETRAPGNYERYSEFTPSKI